MTILDNILLHFLSKSHGETLEEKNNNFILVNFILAILLLCTSLVSLVCGAIITNVSSLQERAFHFFVAFLVLGLSIYILNFFLDKYLKKLIEKHTVIEHSKEKSKEIYKPASEVELSIRGIGTNTSISTKETFSNEELKDIKNRRVIIKASNKGEDKEISGGEVEILLTNKNEITPLNVPEEALVYQIEGISLTKETEQKVCGFIKEKETTILRTKLFLSASVDEELLEKVKNKQELDDLLDL